MNEQLKFRSSIEQGQIFKSIKYNYNYNNNYDNKYNKNKINNN